MLHQFRNTPERFSEIRNRLYSNTLPLLILAILGGAAITYLNADHDESIILPIVITILLGTVVIVFTLYSSLKQQRIWYDSYVLTFDDNSIHRDQDNLPKVIIPYSDVKEIIQTSSGAFVVKSISSKKTIVISAQIEEYEKVKELLSVIKDITEIKETNFSIKYGLILPLFVVLLLVFVYLSTDKILVAISGVILLSTIAYSFWSIQRNKNVDIKLKRASWSFLILFLSILLVMYFKLIS